MQENGVGHALCAVSLQLECNTNLTKNERGHNYLTTKKSEGVRTVSCSQLSTVQIRTHRNNIKQTRISMVTS